MKTVQLDFEAIGTAWKIEIESSLTPDKQQLLFEKIEKRIEVFDKTYSRFRKDSFITEISLNKGTYTFPKDAKALFSFYKNLYDATNHAVTPLIGQALSDAGYDSDYSLKPKSLSNPPSWDDALNYKHPKLEVKHPVLLDFGAAGKGYLVDIVAGLIKDEGLTEFYINAGGDIYQNSTHKQSIKVGLEHPNDFSKVIGVANIHNQSICASSGNRRNWGKFHHIINPHTLSSPRNILSTWAVADTAILADGMTTCLFFEKGEKLQTKFNFEYLILFDDYSYEISSNFPSRLYTNTNTLSL
ncbi:MAG TPA: FAD:protein FMN transferase [Xanthomonadales bacterium]|nr:FAD:protein FMN transferase [Xanthomonadales bacterium]